MRSPDVNGMREYTRTCAKKEIAPSESQWLTLPPSKPASITWSPWPRLSTALLVMTLASARTSTSPTVSATAPTLLAAILLMHLLPSPTEAASVLVSDPELNMPVT